MILGPDQQHLNLVVRKQVCFCLFVMQMSCEVTWQFCFRYTDYDSSSNLYMAVQSNLCHTCNCYAIETEEN